MYNFLFLISFPLLKGIPGLAEVGWSLREVKVVIPDAVRRGENAKMECWFNLEGDSLYSVKWYKGKREFYRHTPKEIPRKKVFPIEKLPDLQVQRDESNETQVVLRNVTPSLSGRYSCEVSADAPSFHTSIVSGDLNVVEPPQQLPTIHGIKSRYRPGDILHATCTSADSRPAANLTWGINGEQASHNLIKPLKISVNPATDLETSSSNLEMVVTSKHFSHHGRLKIRCTANIHTLYWQTTEQSAEEERTRHGEHSRNKHNSHTSLDANKILTQKLEDVDNNLIPYPTATSMSMNGGVEHILPTSSCFFIILIVFACC